VHIFPVKPNHALDHNFCSPQGFGPVKNRHISLRYAVRSAGALSILLLVLAAWAALPARSQDAQPDQSAQGQPAQTIDQIRVIGNRRIPKETILARLFTHVGDVYDPVSIERDFNSLWNTGYFDDLRIERENSEKGIILNIFVREKPNIREINYKGLNSITVSDVLDRFKKEHVGLSVESQYDPTKIKRAETVIKQMLAEHGHQFATIRTEVKTIPPASVQVNFNVKEGPVVKVGHITFTGDPHIGARTLRRSMKNLKPIGIPYSIVFEDLFPQTFDASKLEEDSERVRQVYRDKGYANAAVEQPRTQIRDEGGLNWFTFRPRKGKRIDILLPIEEGDRYRLGTITFSGNKAVTNLKALRATFPIKDGDWFNATDIGKGLENLKKAYGQLGYINFGAIPRLTYDDKNHSVSMNIDIDEGKQFYVSRIEFQGNTITRDRVIRRELLLDEGSVYNSQLWEYSLLRLNQLQYFDPLKVDQDTEAHQNPDNGTVELLLKVKEKGKNSIGLNGGVSGMNGAFLGLNYQTNNFLGLGETLSVQANLGSVQRQFMFGFTQPYIHNRPINVGFQIFNMKEDFNAAKNYQLTTGTAANLSAAEQSLTQNYNQGSTGFNFSVSYPLKRHAFQRVGFTYSLTRSTITAFSTASQTFFQTIAFRSGIQGSNPLAGIVNSSISLSYMYDTVSDPLRPRTGRQFTAIVQGSGLWGDVRYVSPAVAFKTYIPMHYLKASPLGHNVLGIRTQLQWVAGWGGDVAPPNNRFYAGGEADLRGFDIRGATPYGYVPSRINFQLTNPDGNCVRRFPSNSPDTQCLEVPLPVYGIASIGGDTQLTNNLEYRIPVVGPFTFSFYDDFGLDVAASHNQLQQSPQGFASLLAPLYGCQNIVSIGSENVCESTIKGSDVGFRQNIRPVSGTNFVPRMSTGVELGVIMPVINAPFRIYYAYNPLRLYERPYCNEPGAGRNQLSCSTSLITRAMFPPGGAGDYSYQQAIQAYGAQNVFREPRKTFRLTISTTF
jgi:outer membrane protein insertion porin family